MPGAPAWRSPSTFRCRSPSAGEPGIAHLAAVALAWSYNLGLKRTVVSPLPYAVAFGLVPVVVAAMLPGAPAPVDVLIIAGVACGVAAHFANTVGDAAEDAMTGVRGLPQRIGPAARRWWPAGSWRSPRCTC